MGVVTQIAVFWVIIAIIGLYMSTCVAQCWLDIHGGRTSIRVTRVNRGNINTMVWEGVARWQVKSGKENTSKYKLNR